MRCIIYQAHGMGSWRSTAILDQGPKPELAMVWLEPEWLTTIADGWRVDVERS